jgi:hypothetical protein
MILGEEAAADHSEAQPWLRHDHSFRSSGRAASGVADFLDRL